jgi:ABC-type transport system involved in cytochrome c biogenesis permease subunit
LERLSIILFWLALLLSVASSLLYIRNFFAKLEKRWLNEVATGSAAMGFLLLLTAALTRIADPTFSRSALPFLVRLVFAMILIGSFLLVEAIYARRVPKVRVLGMFVMPVVVGLEFIAWHQYSLPGALSQQLKSYWVAIHVSNAILAYGSLTVAVGFAVIYLLQERQLRAKKPSSILRKLPSLQTADGICSKAMLLSFFFLTMVIVTGAIRAEMLPAWQKWYLDPRVLAAFGTWTVYGFYILARILLGWVGKRANALAVVGFFAAIFMYYANTIFPSLHIYGVGF